MDIKLKQIDRERKIDEYRKKILEEKIKINIGKQEVSIMELITQAKDSMIKQEVNFQVDMAYFYCLATFVFSLSLFVLLWFLATKFTSLSIYFNDIFCRSRKYDSDDRISY